MELAEDPMFFKYNIQFLNVYVDVAPEGRPKLNLLPRTVPTQVGETSAEASSSIFGSGKARDVNKPEIKELEERLEHNLAISKKQAAEAAAAAEAAQANSENNSYNEGATSPINIQSNDRHRTTSTNSQNSSRNWTRRIHPQKKTFFFF